LTQNPDKAEAPPEFPAKFSGRRQSAERPWQRSSPVRISSALRAPQGYAAAVPPSRRRIGTDSIFAGSRLRPDDGASPRVQTADPERREQSHRPGTDLALVGGIRTVPAASLSRRILQGLAMATCHSWLAGVEVPAEADRRSRFPETIGYTWTLIQRFECGFGQRTWLWNWAVFWTT